ncbi:MAG: bifunctional precorrin-2 dehydrogenase/sirohydrochlorin ferrochelatase, partial [Chromatiales bacterium]|nr:bifunctional precorrin-2 dehydrogenase/sirohydrochlorin ferrochelatase [Chromatiales bacterium]
MEHLPIFLSVKDQFCAVIGGGEIATRKVSLLLRAGAHVQVIAPGLCPNLAKLHGEGRIEHLARPFQSGDIDEAYLAIAATDDPTVNHAVAAAGRQLNIPVNVVDHPEDGSFIMPSIIDRSPVIAAVSTGGASPVLARLIRARLESVIPAGYGRLAELAGQFRDRVKQAFADPADRRRFWDRVLQGGVAERVFSGHMR